jgi:hypothetical protein
MPENVNAFVIIQKKSAKNKVKRYGIQTLVRVDALKSKNVQQDTNMITIHAGGKHIQITEL